jgi:diguanylate cyclase (GGDEF)-like protein/putative nucleotidyltransferase with HDIG domain
MEQLNDAPARRATWQAAVWWLVVASGAVVAAWGAAQVAGLGAAQAWQSLCLACVVLVAGRLAVRLPHAPVAVTPSDTFIFLAAFFLGAPVAALVAALDGFVAARRAELDARGRAYFAAGHALGGCISSSLFYFIVNHRQLASGHPAIRQLSVTPVAAETLLAAALAMIGAYFAVNTALTAAFQIWLEKPRGGARPEAQSSWASYYLWSFTHTFCCGLGTAAVFVLLVRHSPAYVLALAPVIAASLAACRVFFERMAAAETSLDEVSRLYLNTVEVMATAIDAKDQVTPEHVRRVQIYAEGLGRIFGLAEAEIEALRAGALLHDVGKLAVPDHILNKPGKLTPSEFEKMKIHTVVGAELLARIGFPYPVVPIVRYHHERWDGKGYPEGLCRDEIPLGARILSVADCFDTAREDRPYRRGLTRDEACQLLRDESGRHFDPQVVESFLAHLPDFERRVAAAGVPLEARQATGAAGDANAATQSFTLTPRGVGQPNFLDHIKAAHHEVYSLYELARTFSASLDLEDTVSIFVNKLRHVVPFDTCAIYLSDEEAQSAKLAHAVGKHAEAFAGRVVYPGEGITGWVLANRQPFSNADVTLELAALKLGAGAYRTMAVAPLMKGKLLVGAIALYSAQAERYSDDHLRLLETVSDLAADAFYNALDHAETKHYALTDPLTGLPNSRALHLQFAQEANRCARQDTPLSVMMMDLDGLKEVNDAHGHQVGNELMIGVSKVIASELRSYDYLARYASDEFVAILPGATEEVLDELTERVQRAVAKFALIVGGKQSVGVSVSIGAARHLTEGHSLERLLRIADRRMYKDKQMRLHDFIIEAGAGGDTTVQVSGSRKSEVRSRKPMADGQ